MATTKFNVMAAYGRRYASFFEALRDWNAGKDFKIVGGPYISIRDTYTHPEVHCYFRDQRLTELADGVVVETQSESEFFLGLAAGVRERES